MDYDTAKQAVEDWCAVGWVVEGVSVRCLTPEESREARIKFDAKAALREPLAVVELPNLDCTLRRNYALEYEARAFAMSAA